MSVSIANVALSTDTFNNWLDKTNQILNNLSTVVVTTAANTTGGATSGNAAIVGILNANTLAVGDGLRGGSVQYAANLAITSNVVFSGDNIGGSVSYLNFNSANISFNTTDMYIAGGTLTVSSNLNFKTNTLFINAAGRVGVNTATPDATLAVVGTANVSGNTKFAGITTFQGNTLHQSNTTISLSGAPTTGYLFFGNTGVRTLSYDGSQYVFATANVNVQGVLLADTIVSTNNITLGSGVGSGVYLNGDIKGNSNTCSRTVATGAYLYGGGVLSADLTLNVNAASSATANVLVARDTSGNFAANNITANLNGTSTQSNNIFANGFSYPGAVAKTGNTVVLRDTNGSFNANIMYGTATAAQYADLAELYLSDQEYPVGTVVKIGGEKEITAYTPLDYIRALGTISENPAYLMNKDLVGGLPVALKGRVPVRVLGPITKGQGLGASAIPGVASMNALNYFAVALENYSQYTEGLIEAVIL